MIHVKTSLTKRRERIGLLVYAGAAMADRKGLGLIGFMLGGVAAGIMVIGMVVVQAHVDGRLSLDDYRRPVVSSLPPTTP